MRTFIAFELSSEIKLKLAEIQDKLKKSEADVKWVNPQNIHLTLKFLGNISDLMLKAVREIMEGITARFSPFFVKFAGIGAFPNLRSPRVIWIGIEENTQKLRQLNKNLETNLAGKGFPVEKRKYNPHLTLGRVKSPLDKGKLISAIQSINVGEVGRMEVKEIALIKSEGQPKGPLYTILKKFKLAHLSVRTL